MRQLRHPNSSQSADGRGFALVATVSVMTLLVLVALAMMSLAVIDQRGSRRSSHQAVAQANARLALVLALGELQKHAGPDQRVTARAAILETGGKELPNRNWLGVWKTTRKAGGREWPVVGKAPVGGASGYPYARPGAYEDLRHTDASLADGKWKDKLRVAWLVSQGTANADPSAALDPGDSQTVVMVGKGTLGGGFKNTDRVLVEKVRTGGDGAYAWHVSDNNQKASVDPLAETGLAAAAFEAAPRFNPALIEAGGGTPFAGFQDDARKHPGKLVTYQNAALTQKDSDGMGKLLGSHVHHLTSYSPGLFTDTGLGGLRRDLTPLLLANKGDKVIDFPALAGGSGESFSSSWPVIPGPDHGVLGPSFGALRNWAQHAYSDLSEAETSFPASAVRMRPTTHWPHNIADGACADAAQWAESAPKIHPVMTDCRWHYYFSHHNKRIRTHIIPRVCLWNPYNRSLRIPAMSVLMPNPFYNLSHGMHFFPEHEHVDKLKEKPEYLSDNLHIISRWTLAGGYAEGDVYKMRTNPFPNKRYMAFTLESTLLKPGECHVFSPRVTFANESAGGVKLQRYQSSNPLANILSSQSPQGSDHFFFDHSPSTKYEILCYKTKKEGDQIVVNKDKKDWYSFNNYLHEIDFGRIFDYQPEVVMQSDGKVESFPFVLKAGTSSSLSTLYASDAHPTLQLVYNGAGGAKPTTYFGYIGQTWRSANQQTNRAFGSLQEFSDAPLKDAARNHQVGAKLLWLDESYTEGASEKTGWAPLRGGRWGSDHMVYNVAPIANWNVRAQHVGRSPASQCASKWYMHSMGLWLLQFQPYSPQDVNDQPSLGPGGALVKNPFGSTVAFPFNQNVVLFDLPSGDYGVLSIAKLRHAMLSPYSWTPTYVVGHSLRDMHAPSDFTVHQLQPRGFNGSGLLWDYLVGGAKGSGLSHGPYSKLIDSQGLLQIGNQAATRKVGASTLSSQDEVLAYDIAFEVNQNLWDRYFLSGIPLADGTGSFDWGEGGSLWNTRYQFNPDSGLGRADAGDLLAGSEGLNAAFWRSAEFVKNKAAFNVNSTSVEAWTAFLSGTLGEKRPLRSGELAGDVVSFARYGEPSDAVETNEADPEHAGAWIGARKLTDDEVRTLAGNIVAEVRKRGPFVSVADFVNRRLADATDETSHMGTLDAAIRASGLNSRFERDGKFRTTAVNRGTRTDAPDNNHPTLRDSYRYRGSGGQFTTVQPASQAWGLPGFLTQGDLLEPLAPAMAARGDTFTIRAYGESREGGVVKARAWLEATVERTPGYVFGKPTGSKDTGANAPGDIPLRVEHATGQYLDGNLTDANKRFGRQFVIRTFRWLSPGEI